MSTRTRSLVFRIAYAAILTATAATLFAPTVAGAAPTFSFAGTGWGHGIGLSQYGAKGYAEHGKSGEWIAAHYYPGSYIGEAAERAILVNIDEAADYASGGNNGYTKTTWTLIPGWVGTGLSLDTGQALGDTTSGYTFTAVGDAITVKNSSNAVVAGPSKSITVAPTGAAPGEPALIQVAEGSGVYDAKFTRYRGRLVLTASGGKIKALNSLTMSEYLYGVVPRESPSSWHIEALKAQAYVARSYAQKSRTELYCTTYSQAYAGHSRGQNRASAADWEAPSSNSAVDATAGKFVLYGGNVITTYFCSSSGGYTANISDVWLGSTQYPYYTGVEDPYSEEMSPNDPWPSPVVVDGMTLAAKLAPKISGEPAGAGSSIYVKSLALDRAYPSNFVRKVDVTWSNGTTTNGVAGDTLRSALAMKSTKFFLGGMYDRVSYSNRYSTAVKISQNAFPESGVASAVVVVNGADEKFADALTASALGGVAGGPVLMVQANAVPSEVSAEIARLGVKKAYVVGGPASVSAGVFNAVRAIVPDTERLAGDARYGTNRYGTAASVAMKMKALGADGTKVLVASGEKWTDAAVAAAVAAGAKRPIVLTAGGSLPAGTRQLLLDLGATETSFFGGPATIGGAVTAQICSLTHEAAPTRRFGLSGGRYDVAVGAAQWCVSDFGYTPSTVYLSSGEKFPDTVTGGVLAGLNKHPLVLTATSSASPATAAYLAANKAAIDKVVVLGGPASVSDKAASLLSSYAY